MARRPHSNRVIWTYPDSGDEDLIFTTPENAWMIAENSAEHHVAGWLFYLADRPVPEFRLATQVTAEGLPRHRPHPNGTFTWQVEGCALIIAAGLDQPALDAYLSDYRTAEGRIDRLKSASSKRAALICAEMEAGAPPRVAIDRHRLPSVKRGPSLDEQDIAALAFYREMVSAGELVE